MIEHQSTTSAGPAVMTAPAEPLWFLVRRLALSFLPLLLLAAPLPTLAQGAAAEASDGCAWESRAADRMAADLLYQKGQRLAADRAWSEAAAAVEASAMLHPRCLEEVERFREAGRLFHYAGELEQARLAMIAAGERAVELQHPALAAHAYLDAADLAQLMGDLGAAMLPISAALELARSPALSKPEREEIARRLGRDASDASGADGPRAAASRGS